MVATIEQGKGNEFMSSSAYHKDRKYHADYYTCCPPPLFSIVITLLELGFFIYYYLTTNPGSLVPVDSVFIYRPDRRSEVWRFLLYMLLHACWLQLGFNLVVQMLVGLPLEMVHGSGRVAVIYMAGVMGGSLGTSVFDTDVYLVGASGGVYALLAAHLANVLLNYHHMQCGILRLIGICAIASCDVGYTLYSRLAADSLGPPVSYVAHLTGALAGLATGILVLKNFDRHLLDEDEDRKPKKLHAQLLWWVTLGVFAACIIFAILFNVAQDSNIAATFPASSLDERNVTSPDDGVNVYRLFGNGLD